jgi:hypothetical protein
LGKWLTAYIGETCPPNFRKDFDAVKRMAGFGNPKTDPKLEPWIDDVLRHTGVSHHFRKTGSYGLTAEESGNSEAIIKKHYQSRVSSNETKKFYALAPKKESGK